MKETLIIGNIITMDEKRPFAGGISKDVYFCCQSDQACTDFYNEQQHL